MGQKIADLYQNPDQTTLVKFPVWFHNFQFDWPAIAFWADRSVVDLKQRCISKSGRWPRCLAIPIIENDLIAFIYYCGKGAGNGIKLFVCPPAPTDIILLQYSYGLVIPCIGIFPGFAHPQRSIISRTDIDKILYCTDGSFIPIFMKTVHHIIIPWWGQNCKIRGVPVPFYKNNMISIYRADCIC